MHQLEQPKFLIECSITLLFFSFVEVAKQMLPFKAKVTIFFMKPVAISRLYIVYFYSLINSDYDFSISLRLRVKNS